MQYKIGVIVGSLRQGAYSRLVAEAVKILAPPSLSFVDIGIGELPLYNLDLDTETPPPAWATFRSQVTSTNGVLFVSPEYNRGIPGALKNAIDVGSRPRGHSVWSGKPTAIITQSPGSIGGMAANQQLRLILSVLDSPTLPGNEMYIPRVNSLFDEAGRLANQETRQLISSFLRAFESWLGRFAPLR
jgi:chromate reductase, NAD(P)H dehydrogenase (quinone)